MSYCLGCAICDTPLWSVYYITLLTGISLLGAPSNAEGKYAEGKYASIQRKLYANSLVIDVPADDLGLMCKKIGAYKEFAINFIPCCLEGDKDSTFSFYCFTLTKNMVTFGRVDWVLRGWRKKKKVTSYAQA